MAYMGVDIGTSGCKAVIFDEGGEQIALASQEYNLIYAEAGGAELNADQVITKCFEVIRQCTDQAPPGCVKGLGISSQGEAFTALDDQGAALCGAMVSSDSRAAPYIESCVREIGEDKLYRITGHTAHPMFTLFKLIWLRENRRDLWKMARKFLCFEDLLHLRLGIEPSISWPLAGRTMLFDVERHAWSSTILDVAGITPEQLARPLPSGEKAGIIPESLCLELGLSSGAYVVTGGHDQPCGALGAGVTEPGLGMYATGTVECIAPAFEKAVYSESLKRNNLCTYHHTVRDMYTTIAYSLTGGNILKWFRDELAGEERREAESSGRDTYATILENLGSEPSPLLVLPYFTPSGTPHFDLTTPGAILGLRLTTGRSDILRALLEGVALEMKLNLHILGEEGCDIHELRAIGGGAKSTAWLQLKADVLGKSIVTLNVTEAVSLGAAMLARVADTGENLKDLASEWIQPVEKIQPNRENSDSYAEKFSQYQGMYTHIREFYLS